MEGDPICKQRDLSFVSLHMDHRNLALASSLNALLWWTIDMVEDAKALNLQLGSFFHFDVYQFDFSCELGQQQDALLDGVGCDCGPLSSESN